jgi:tRNA (guanine-N7-)-methyltransferase
VRRTPRLPLEELAPYLLEAPNPPARLNWAVVFGNDRPVELEVGFGKGLFLITSAAARPETNFLGVEILRKYLLFTATRLAKRGLRNVRVAYSEARLFLRDCVPATSLQVVHVYFPDPWWKKRHHKRRVFTDEFAQQCQRVLRPGGELSAATDVQEYSAIMAEVMAGLPAFHAVPPPEAGTPAHDLDYLTNFERKFRKQGKPIYRLRYQRANVASAVTS